MPAAFDRGIDGSISGGITGRIYQWEVQGQQVVVDISAYGDGGASRVDRGKRMFFVRANGHSIPGTARTAAFKAMGTAYVTLLRGTTEAYKGEVVYSGNQDGSNYKNGDSPMSFSGVFDGDPA